VLLYLLTDWYVNLPLFASWFGRRIPIPNHANHSQGHANCDMEIKALFSEQEKTQGQHKNSLHVA
jgi:hypothetical protein